MPRLAAQKTDLDFKRAKPKDRPYQISDGGGLSMRVQPTGGKAWLFRYRRPETGKETFIGLGAYPDVSAAEARLRASECRNKLSKGVDPGDERRDARKRERLGTFDAVAAAWLEFKRQGWADETHRKASYVIDEYLIPKLKGKSIATLATPDAAVALRFVAESSPHLAEKARQYLHSIVTFAMQQGLREDGRFLALRGVIAPFERGHIPAITKPTDIGPLARAIDAYPSVVTRAALTLSMLTAQRPGTIVCAKWADISLEAAEWHIPPEDMKTKHAHIVPLPIQAVGLLKTLRAVTGGSEYVFPAQAMQHTPHVHRDSLSNALRKMGFQGQHAAHGFRGMLRTVARERLGVDPDVLEAQLAHAKRDDIQKAYDRTTFDDKRRRVMQEWADYIDRARKSSQKVVELKGGKVA